MQKMYGPEGEWADAHLRVQVYRLRAQIRNALPHGGHRCGTGVSALRFNEPQPARVGFPRGWWLRRQRFRGWLLELLVALLLNLPLSAREPASPGSLRQ